MRIEFDPQKDASNQEKHGLSLADVARLDIETASVIPDERFGYGEPRYRAFGLMDGRLHILAFTMRGDTLRAISFRKANATEVKRHG